MPKRQGTSAVRGGRHQRRKAEAAAAAQLEECHAIASIDGLSPIVFKLIEHWAWGGSSALEVCDLARAVTNTFSSVPADVQALAGCGSHGHQPSNSQRDLLRLPALQNLQSPEPFHVTAWVILNPGTRPVLSQEEIAVFLPHDWGSCLSRHGLLDQTVGSLKDAAGFWQEVLPDDPKLFGMDPIFFQHRDFFMPFAVHADKGPHSKQDSLHTITFYSLIAQARKLGIEESSFLLTAVPNSCLVTEKKCKDLNLTHVEPTMVTLGKVFSWSFQAWFEGKHPSCDPWGNGLEGQRLELAGKPICRNKLRCVVWAAPADCEHNSLEYGLPNYNSNEPCMRCKCNRSDAPWNDVSPNAAWRDKPYSKEELQESPLTSHWLLSISGVSHFTFAYDFMHCADLGFSSACVANVFYDMVFKHLPGKKPEKVVKLLDLIHAAYEDLEVEDGRISKLALSHFCDVDAPHQHYPSLMHSAIKAKQTARLTAVCLKLCADWNDGTEYCVWRYKCLHHLNKLYTISEDAGMFFSEQEFADYTRSANRFLQYYTKLSDWSFRLQNCRIGQFQWGQLPKMHFLFHIAEDSKFLNPRVVWAYPGEHLVGNATRLASACLAGLQAYQVPNTVCRKYQIGKHLQFLQLS